MLLFAGKSPGQIFTDGFNYYLLPQDTSSAVFLPPFPQRTIEASEFISIDHDGHFAVNGNRVRFFGTNLVADGAFPAKEKAWFIAGHLRKMGFNLVRFHHLDNPWSPQSIFEQEKDTRHLNPVTFDRLENIIAELKRNGVYINMNLHVSRTLNAHDGVPEYDSLPEFGKVVNYFDPQMLALHKEYARELLTHVNPYTGKSLPNDPVMAMMEITNENSLYRAWRDGSLVPRYAGGLLTVRHTKMLDSLWEQFLINRYGTTDSLRVAWSAGVIDRSSTNQIRNGGFELNGIANWVIEKNGTAAAVMATDSVNAFHGKYACRVTVQQSDGTDWHLQFKEAGLSLAKDSLYVISFAARSDSQRTISCTVQKETSPWTWYGGSSASLTTQWKTYSFAIRASEALAGDVRLSFGVGAHNGAYWFDEVIFGQPNTNGLLAGESLESKTVQRVSYAACSSYSDQRVRDISAFYIGLQSEYFTQMRTYLRDSLNVKVPIVGTNWNVGPADLAAQSTADYVDNHAYWDHPSFPSIPWSATDWLINNTAMVNETNGGTIPGLMAGVPMKNKPYTISEYNHAFPNRYQTEGVLFLSSYASFHGVDGLMFFDYNGSWDDWETDKVGSYFNIARNSVMMALMPSCAYAYRNGLISPAALTLYANYSRDDYLLLPKRDASGWSGPSLFLPTLALEHAVRIGTFDAGSNFDAGSLPAVAGNPYVTDTKQINWNTSGLFTVSSPQFAAITGFLYTGAGVHIGPLTLQNATEFGTLTWLSLTGDSLTKASRSLLTVSSRTQNVGMIWDGTRTVHNSWGQAPTIVQSLELSLKIALRADSLSVIALDPTGAESSSATTYYPVGQNLFDIKIMQTQPEGRALWFGLRGFGAGATQTVGGSETVLPGETELRQNYPNPFNPSTVITYRIAKRSHVLLRVFDILGRNVGTLVNDEVSAGNYSVTLHAEQYGMRSGMYFYRLQAGGYDRTKRLVVQH